MNINVGVQSNGRVWTI